MLPKISSLRWEPLALDDGWTPSEHTCLQSNNTCLVLDAVNGRSCLIRTSNDAMMYVDAYGNVGINTTSPSTQLQVVSDNGACLRLSNSAGAVDCDMSVDDAGNLTISPDGLGVTMSKSMNIMGHNGRDAGLYLRGRLVSATAEQLNYTCTTIGMAQPYRALVVDDGRNISGINQLSLTTPLAPQSGGTGYGAYQPGDILVAGEGNSLHRLGSSDNLGDLLIADPSSDLKMRWGVGLMRRFLDMGIPTWTSPWTYTVPYVCAKNAAGTSDIAMDLPIVVNAADLGTLNGCAYSDALPGQASAAATLVSGINSTFASDLMVGDVITIGPQARRIVSIASNTELEVDTPMTLANQWSSTGTIVSGHLSLTNAQLAQFIMGDAINMPAIWTLSIVVSVATNATLVQSDDLTIDLQKGILHVTVRNVGTITRQLLSMQQKNSTVLSPSYISVVFDGAAYRLYVDGVGALIAASPVAISLHQISLNGPCTFIEWKLSNIVEHTADFTPSANPSVADSNTLSLQRFSAMPLTDDVTHWLPWHRGGTYGVSYLYALGGANPGYVFSHRPPSKELVDLPAGYSASDARALPFFVAHGASECTTHATSATAFSYFPMPSLALEKNNLNPVGYDLSNLVPEACVQVSILLTHRSADNVASNVIVSDANSRDQPWLPTTVVGSQQIAIDVPIVGGVRMISARVSLATSFYSLELKGFVVG